MPLQHVKKKRPRNKTAPASILYTRALNEDGHRQICVMAKCEWSDRVVGPTWSHTAAAVRRALATLTEQCDCPATYHKAQEFHGQRVLTPARRHEV